MAFVDRYLVAPYVGAWIETLTKKGMQDAGLSHPTWVRGLKPSRLLMLVISMPSHPTWVRGLKLRECELVKRAMSRTLRGCVD